MSGLPEYIATAPEAWKQTKRIHERLVRLQQFWYDKGLLEIDKILVKHMSETLEAHRKSLGPVV